MELWDVLDEKGNKTGKTVERGQVMEQDEYHLLINVWIRNKNGEYLITKRAPIKKVLPNMWETTCGAAITGEDSLETVLREVREEIGVQLSPQNGKFIFRIKRHSDNISEFVDVWLFEEEIDINKIVYQPEEVCGAKWAAPNKIKAMIESGEFANTFTYLEDIFKIS